ncbi:MAG: GNAT family N-acetyltransferase [Planctomycetes bacterium]|nr:GNAT family N-acetyltransferase [Planctomycetota bacterium]
MWTVRTDSIRYGCAGCYPPHLVAAWADVEMPPDFVHELRKTEFFVAEDAVGVLGFAFLDLAEGQVKGVFVAPRAVRRGVGTLLMKTLEECARSAARAHLQLNASLNAESFYRSLGFVALERTLWRHSNGFHLPCIRMSKVLGRGNIARERLH